MLGLKVHKKGAETAKRYLVKNALLDNQLIVFGSNSFIYLPIKGEISPKKKQGVEKATGGKLVSSKFEKSGVKGKYRELLQKRLGKSYDDVTKSYDIVGNIALIDAKGRPATQMAKAIMQTNKNVLTVISKGGAVSGKYRVRKYAHILGKKNFIADYRENGIELKFDIRKTFFSSRLAFERLRIAKLVRPKENVVVMFAGMGPFAIEIGKMQRQANVVGIELNKDACRYMKQNIALNKTGNVVAELGNVKRVADKYKGFADRIVMPLPKTAFEFLGAVLKVAKRKCIVHYYAFGDRETGFEDEIKKVRNFFEKKGRKVKILDKRVVRQYSAKEVEIVLDILVG
ncbi:MAG: class I SAM-dependent methyltransferase family protein [Candidatus Micrarchaeota archaeon]|nr:class I SAM-dependent methyltransferase family protein [Candidatus Micrarchaeota archaeon]